jgi:imidazolonepropionase-like amidohydrolase
MRGLLVVLTLGMLSSGVLAQPIAIVGGTIIDGNGGRPIENGVLLIEGKRIIAVGGRSMALPPQARKISAAGRYVMPGLMDANVHLVIDAFPFTLIRYEGRYQELAIEAAQIALKSGVTTVFDSWGPHDALMAARTAISEGRVVGSRIYLAGTIVGLGGPFSGDFAAAAKESLPEDFTQRINALWQQNVGPELMAMSPEQVRVEIRKYARSGIDFLKYAVNAHASPMIQFSPRVQQVIVEEAHRAGLTVQTHTMSGEGIELAVRAGVDLMQHCEITLEQSITAETIELIAQRQVPCALLPHTDAALAFYKERAPALPFLAHFALDDVNERALLRSRAVIVLSTDSGVWSVSTLNSAFWKQYDAPQSLLVLGEGHFNWFVAMEQKGMPAMDSLLAATRNIARAYKVDKDLGTLEKGKIADLLILDENPLASAANYRSISLVMKEGSIVDREVLPTQRLLTAQTAHP